LPFISVTIPVIGNGDISTGKDVEHRKKTTAVSGIMIGRAAMQNPWVFRDAKHYLKTGQQLSPAPLEERWKLIKRHCRQAIDWGRYGNERQTLMAMRSRLMAYSKGIPGSKRLRSKLSTIVSMAEIETLSMEHIKFHENKTDLIEPVALV
jgi:tRNA-dihydrouridine synthase B